MNETENEGIQVRYFFIALTRYCTLGCMKSLLGQIIALIE
jgi:hypothetical protein